MDLSPDPISGRRMLVLRVPAAMVPAAALLAAAALVGCGGGSSSSTAGSTGVSAVPAQAQQSRVRGETIAMVEQMPITKADFAHWMSVGAALSAPPAHVQAPSTALKGQVLNFLISSDWMLGEAAHLGISASEAEVQQRFAQLKRQRFPKAAEFSAFLTRSHESLPDLLLRIKIELLQSKISQHVTAGKTATTESRVLLAGFQRSFETRWKSRTSCSAGYIVEYCKEFKGPSNPAHPPAASGSPSGSAGGASTGGTSAGGEAPPSPGSMSVSSPAFTRNGTIPVAYTCAGADVSPPLQWQNLPAHTAELVLFAIDESAEGTAGGIRWVVAGIDPKLSGIAAGSLPTGAVVGRNSAGRADYGGICPAKGQRDTIEFVLWALKRKMHFRPGFIPGIAEHEYSTSELASASIHATFRRP